MTDELCITGACICIILAILVFATCLFLTGGYDGYANSNKH